MEIFLKLLVLFDQFMSIQCAFWRVTYLTKRKAIVLSFLIIIVFTLFNLLWSFTTENTFQNFNSSGRCISTVQVWLKVLFNHF